jgi:carbon monoxide dehydrogenase subunit G
MLTLEQIEFAILQLSPDEYKKLIEWFADLDYQRWDKQLEKDIVDGKLEALAQEAIAEFKAGHCREI